MSKIDHRAAALALIFTFMLVPALRAQESADQAAVRGIVRRFFVAVNSRNVEQAQAVWSSSSPEFGRVRETALRSFIASEAATLGDITMSRWEAGDGRASARLRVEFTVRGERGEQASKVTETWNAQFVNAQFIKELGGWKWWKWTDPYTDLAGELYATHLTGDKAERARLLRDESELVTSVLVERLNERADHEAKQGKFPDASALNDLAFEVAAATNSKRDAGWCYFYRGLMFNYRGMYREELSDLRKAMGLFEEAGDKRAAAQMLNNVGSILSFTGQYAEAVKAFDGALKAKRELGDKGGEALTLNNQGLTYVEMGRYDDALKNYETSLQISRDEHLPNLEAQTLKNFGELYVKDGRFEDALKDFSDALKIAQELSNDKYLVAALLNNIGQVYLLTGRFAEALEQFRLTLKTAGEINDVSILAITLRNLGNVHRNVGRYAEALKQFQNSLEISRKLGVPAQEADALTDIAQSLALMGRPDEALATYQEGLKVARGSGAKENEAAILNGIGAIYTHKNDYAEALARLEEGLKIARDIGSQPQQMVALNNSGDVYRSLGKYAEALVRFRESLQLSREVRDKTGESFALANMAKISLDEGKYAEALDLLQESLNISETLGDPDAVSRINWMIGSVWLRQKKWGPAAEAYRKSIGQIETLRRQTAEPSLQVSFLQQFSTPFRGLADCLLELGSRPEEVFAVSESAKARALAEMMAGGNVNVLAAATESERERERKLNAAAVSAAALLNAALSRPTPEPQQISALRQSLTRARSEYDNFRRQLFIAHPELRTRQAEFEPAALGRLSQTLFDKEPNLCLLSYFFTLDKVLLFVVTRVEGVPIVTVHTLKALDGRPLTQEDLHRRLSDFGKRYKSESGVYTTEARALYKILLLPAEAALAGKTHVVIVPDGALNTLPFHILMDDRGRHLIEDRGVSYAPSVTALVEMVSLADRRKGEPGGPRTLFAMGRRTFTDQPEFIKQELSWAEEQVISIARLFGAEAYTKEAATKANALAEMGKAKYIHFSTHAELNNVMPMYSAVVLGKGPNDDGMLYARELSEMRLKADLVVLSACETGLGQQISGEGILGLAWALFAGGAPSSVVTQWKVQDQSMTELMLEFYKQMRRPGRDGQPVSMAEALRQAQLKLLRADAGAYKHPYHWGGAILLGDWR